jgi:peptidoglycan/LPS O-acetylase OafA/YrhL
MIFDRNHHSGFFSFWGTLYIFPFFLLGLGIQRFQHILFRKSVLRVAGFILMAGIILQQLDWFRILDTGLERKSLITLVTSLSGIVVLFRIRRNISILSRLGYYSYSIYLFHVFGGSGARIVLQWIGIENKGILFAGAMLTAILLALVIERIVLPYNWPRFLFLGLRLQKPSPESPVSSPFRRDKTLYHSAVHPKRNKSA